MKRTILFSLLTAAIILTGCNKQSQSSTTPVPLGTFTGKLVVIHKNGKTSKLDTVTSSVTLLMSASAGYALTADTSVAQAGSHGPFTLNSQYITFTDQTAPAGSRIVGTSAKIHLNGTYTYGYDGTNFDFYATSADTLGYSYLLVKN